MSNRIDGTDAGQPCAGNSLDQAAARLKKLRMRSARRGTREMDLILGPFAAKSLAGLDGAMLDLFERLLDENDHELYLWVTGVAAPPAAFGALIARIADHSGMAYGRNR